MDTAAPGRSLQAKPESQLGSMLAKYDPKTDLLTLDAIDSLPELRQEDERFELAPLKKACLYLNLVSGQKLFMKELELPKSRAQWLKTGGLLDIDLSSKGDIKANLAEGLISIEIDGKISFNITFTREVYWI